MSENSSESQRAADVIERLYATILDRKGADAARSYTASLFAGGPKLICRKVGEEAIEVTIEGLKGDKPAIVRESADLIYHLMVLWAEAGVRPEDVWEELARREGTSGIAEKAARGGAKDGEGDT
ncbi:MAG: phosphoribosyl-ATP diphosphatase [Alphaproteobacteria bacterium]|nr:phosphoribosyl-ATP diphosphatase [Alphaproteobacteria bacterium]